MTRLPALEALHQRLTAVRPELLPGGAPEPTGHLAQDTAELLHALVAALADAPSRDRVWLLLVAVSGVFPLDDEVRAAQRQLELVPVSGCLAWLLENAHAATASAGASTPRIRLVREGVLLDVDFAAKHDLQTGVQRVVRRLAPRWHDAHRVDLVVWTERATALRAPVPDEEERVLRWTRPLNRRTAPPVDPVVVVPWRSCLVLPEVPGTEQCARLASLAEHSGNRVAVVGHDCIPVVMADLLPVEEPTKFVRYLSLVKHVDIVAAVSDSAAREFRGFTHALATQGLPGPHVLTCRNGVDLHAVDPGTVDLSTSRRQRTGDLPEVLVVGSHEPRKNHLAVLFAAEVLWREGLRFRLRFIGSSGWSTTRFDHRLRSLTRAGRPVVAERGLDDAQLWEAFRSASFTVFPSLHEGYGLPVVESLAVGTPVIGTSYGSIGESGAEGGVVLVDPRDEDAITATMRHLLTDPAELRRLRREALTRPHRTWDDHARDLWHAAVEGHAPAAVAGGH